MWKWIRQPDRMEGNTARLSRRWIGVYAGRLLWQFCDSVQTHGHRFNGTAGIPAASTSMTAPLILPKTLVLVGMMGAGKTAIGRRLATRLALPFVDADAEIEQAAGSSIPEIFERHGEAAFREGERRVIARLLRQPVHVQIGRAHV